MRKSITFPGKSPRHLILKKFIVDKPFNDNFPEYIVAFPDGLIKDNSKEYQYSGEVVDSNAMPVKKGFFVRFASGSTYQCINTSYGCRKY